LLEKRSLYFIAHHEIIPISHAIPVVHVIVRFGVSEAPRSLFAVG
jgi:hypothetical protein